MCLSDFQFCSRVHRFGGDTFWLGHSVCMITVLYCTSIYLKGLLVKKQRILEVELRRRCEMTKPPMHKLLKIWIGRKIIKHLKNRPVHFLIFLILTYSIETWSMRKSERNKIDVIEIYIWWIMRRISWFGRRTNVSIMQELNILECFSIAIQSRVLKCFGNILRKDPDNTESLIIQG